MAAPHHVVGLGEKFGAVTEFWTPKIIAQVNDMHLKVVRVLGEFDWHVHEDTDECFLVRSGTLTIQMRGMPDAVLGPDDLFVVPRGVEHRPVADAECEILLLEPAGLVNTGDGSPTTRTAPTDEWI